MQYFVGVSIPSQVVADSPQHLSQHSVHYPIHDLGARETNPSLAEISWAQEPVWHYT